MDDQGSSTIGNKLKSEKQSKVVKEIAILSRRYFLLAKKDVKSASDNYKHAAQGHFIRKICKDEIAEQDSADNFKIMQRCQRRGWRKVQSIGHQQM